MMFALIKLAMLATVIMLLIGVKFFCAIVLTVVMVLGHLFGCNVDNDDNIDHIEYLDHVDF